MIVYCGSGDCVAVRGLVDLELFVFVVLVCLMVLCS